MLYMWVKTFHVVFAIAWMAAVFYLPRILINIKEAGSEPAIKTQLELMGRRLYRFGHIVFGFAFVFGLILWLYFGFGGNWLYMKLGFVFFLLLHFIWTGRQLRRSTRGKPLPPARTLRILNELPVLLLIGVIYVVFAKPHVML